MRQILCTILLGMLCILAIPGNLYAADEARYGLVSEEWTLNPDGSREYRYQMELTLFTHTAMNNTYGETFIAYDPKYQQLKINEAYTKQKDGTIIRTPENAFVEVLPSYAADAAYYNRLKEMVVVHTGLELGATIYLDYTIQTKAGYLDNQLDIFRELWKTSPVGEYRLKVTLPNEKELKYSTLHLKQPTVQQKSNNLRQYTWTLKNIPAKPRETGCTVKNGDIPYFLASTYESKQKALQIIYRQFNRKDDMQLQALAEYLTESCETDRERVLTLHQAVTRDIDFSPVTLEQASYEIRPAYDLYTSAYGTETEKINLLCRMLQSIGITAAPYVINYLPKAETVFSLTQLHPFIIAKADGKTYLLNATGNSPDAAGWYADRHETVSFDGKTTAIQTLHTAIHTTVTASFAKNNATLCQMTISVPEQFLPYKENAASSLSPDVTLSSATGGNSTVSYKQEEAYTETGGILLVNLPKQPYTVPFLRNICTESHRATLLSLPYAPEERYNYTIEIPDTLVCLTKNRKETIENRAGKMTFSIKQEGNRLIVEKSLHIYEKEITPKLYADFRELVINWECQEFQTLLFTKNK